MNKDDIKYINQIHKEIDKIRFKHFIEELDRGKFMSVAERTANYYERKYIRGEYSE